MVKDRFKLIPAVYLLLRQDDKILLLRRANTGYQDGKYSVPAGHLEGNELGSDAIIREAYEETGIRVTREDVKFVHLCHRLNRNEPGQERMDIFYEATQWQGEITNKEPEKCGDLTWYPVNNLPNDTIPLIIYVINHVQAGTFYSEYETEPTQK